MCAVVDFHLLIGRHLVMGIIVLVYCRLPQSAFWRTFCSSYCL